MSETTLYRLFDEAGELLYVGISGRWVRLGPASLPEDGLAGVTLREPRDLHELIEKHSQYDAPLPLAAVVEEP